jgi:hypothetical protein
MTNNKLCKRCVLELRGMEREGDICLQCLASMRPHTTYHEDTFNYSTIEGMIRQSTNNPINKTDEKTTDREDQERSM